MVHSYSIGDGIAVLALAGLFLGYLYLKSREKLRRLEIVHQERLVAMDKGIPLPELPIDPPKNEKPPDPHVPLILGIVLLTFGAGSMIALRLIPNVEKQPYWPLPLPVAMIGLGLMLYHFLAGQRER
jgi:hypothetical protein